MNKFLKIFIVAVIYIYFSHSITDLFADSHILILKDGREYRGSLEKITDTFLEFTHDGEVQKYKRSEVDKLNFNKKRKFDELTDISQIEDSFVKESWQLSKKVNSETKGSDEDIVVVNKKTQYIIEDNQTVHKVSVALKILTEAGLKHSNQYLSYMSGREKATLEYALTVHLDGSLYAVDQEAINDEPYYNVYGLYDIKKRMKFAMKKTEVSSLLLWSYTISSNADRLGDFYIDEGILSSYYKMKDTVSVNANKPFDYYVYPGEIPFTMPEIVFNDRSLNITITNQEKTVITERNFPSNQFIYPKLMVTADKSWQSIGNNYYDKFIRKNDIDYSSLRVLRDIEPAKSLDFLKEVYYAVNRNITLVDIPLSDLDYAVSEGQQLVKSQALTVLDKTFLVLSILENAGFDANLLFYKSFASGELIDKVRTIRQFDSVLLSVKFDDKLYILSFEDQNLGFGQRLRGADGVKCFKIADKGSEIVSLGMIDNDSFVNRIQYDCQLSGKDLLVTRKTYVSEYNSRFYRDLRLKSKRELDRWFERRTGDFGNDASLLSYNITSDIDNFEEPLIFEEVVNVRNYIQKSGEKLVLFHLPDFEYDASEVFQEDRSLTFLFYRSKTIYEYDIKLLDGYKVRFLPVNEVIEGDNFIFNQNYTDKNDSITANISMENKVNLIDKTGYGEIKKYYEKRAKIKNNWIILEKK